MVEICSNVGICLQVENTIALHKVNVCWCNEMLFSEANLPLTRVE